MLFVVMGIDVCNLEDFLVVIDDFLIVFDDFVIFEIEEFIGDGFCWCFDFCVVEVWECFVEIFLEVVFLELCCRFDFNFIFGYSGFYEDVNYVDGFENVIFGC